MCKLNVLVSGWYLHCTGVVLVWLTESLPFRVQRDSPRRQIAAAPQSDKLPRPPRINIITIYHHCQDLHQRHHTTISCIYFPSGFGYPAPASQQA